LASASAAALTISARATRLKAWWADDEDNEDEDDDDDDDDNAEADKVAVLAAPNTAACARRDRVGCREFAAASAARSDRVSVCEKSALLASSPLPLLPSPSPVCVSMTRRCVPRRTAAGPASSSSSASIAEFLLAILFAFVLLLPPVGSVAEAAEAATRAAAAAPIALPSLSSPIRLLR
jgi:hypothetical protein